MENEGHREHCHLGKREREGQREEERGLGPWLAPQSFQMVHVDHTWDGKR